MAQLLTYVFTEKFNSKLPIFLANPNHPGFYSRKMSGSDRYEGRLTKHYRFTYEVVDAEIQFFTIGPHDEGLGKK